MSVSDSSQSRFTRGKYFIGKNKLVRQVVLNDGKHLVYRQRNDYSDAKVVRGRMLTQSFARWAGRTLSYQEQEQLESASRYFFPVEPDKKEYDAVTHAKLYRLLTGEDPRPGDTIKVHDLRGAK